MATIDNKQIIDDLISKNGFFKDDPRVFQIVEYTNFSGVTTWGVTWMNELPSSKVRYMNATEYVRNPRVIWRAS